MESYYIFYDLQTGGFSAHTTIEGLSDMLIDDWLSTVNIDENYIGEYEAEKSKWGNANLEMRKSIIKNYEYEILEPTKKYILDWESYHGMDWKYT